MLMNAYPSRNARAPSSPLDRGFIAHRPLLSI